MFNSCKNNKDNYEQPVALKEVISKKSHKLTETTEYAETKTNRKYNSGYKQNILTDAEKNQRKYYPKFSKKGYKLISLSPDLYKEIQKFWEKHKHIKEPELQKWVVSDYKKENGEANLFMTQIHKNPSLVNKINKEVEDKIIEWVTDENTLTWNWYHQIADYADTTKVENNSTEDIMDLDTLPLTHTSTYGIRTYGPGNELAVHLDKGKTHILSAIIYVDRTGKLDHNGNLPNWAIDVQGFEDKEMKPVFMDKHYNLLLYESATVFHGRTTQNPLDTYSNMYVHFKPNKWDKKN
jgi:hypothetical protein